MKKFLLGLFGLALGALLAGCANSPSTKDQASLIEYEACITKQEKIQQDVREIIFRNQINLDTKLSGIINQGVPDPSTGLITSLETMIKNCAKYRP